MRLPTYRAIAGASARLENAQDDEACTQLEKVSAFHTYWICLAMLFGFALNHINQGNSDPCLEKCRRRQFS
jgi:hypothetical protein